ncbi:DUF998 domain-containing protein [Streptomyces sp. NPDC053493]|uniref:DUF998 domain-containing protein n=1 Tax=Streptomyces sp. NPDC053493 TaxID=3365705 RepID=UPI0037D94134
MVFTSVGRAAAVLLALGALAYTAWVLEVVLRTGLDPVRTYVSELAAADQPLGGLFRATDLTAGLLVLAGATAGLAATARRADARPVPRRPWLRGGLLALALFGAATVADSRLPLSCAPTVDPECAARETAGLVPATHAAHAVSSTLAMTGALAAMLALTVAARRYGIWAPLARLGPALVVAEFAATAWTLAAVAAFEAGGGTSSLGAGQRLQVLVVALWLGLLAHSVRQEETARRRSVRERPRSEEQGRAGARAGERERGQR